MTDGGERTSAELAQLARAARRALRGEAGAEHLAPYLQAALYSLGEIWTDPAEPAERRQATEVLWHFLGQLHAAALSDGDSPMRLILQKRQRGPRLDSSAKWDRLNAALRVEHLTPQLGKEQAAVQQVRQETGLSRTTIHKGLRELRAARERIWPGD